jgi:hypothetical protein
VFITIIQAGTRKIKHEKRMKTNNNDNQQVYQWHPLPKSPELIVYVENPLDDLARVENFE